MSEYEGLLTRGEMIEGWVAATGQGLELYGERRDFALDPEPMALSRFMEFDHVIFSWGDGRHAQAIKGLWAPVYNHDRDEHGEWLDPQIEGENREKWSLMHGYSGQHSYRGPWMHQSEFIGGRLAEDILNTRGIFVAVYPSSLEEDYEPDSWAVAYISENIPGAE